ncbi:MAG: hypothetical protein ACFFCO_10855 [Promethearchaeota archaeon]
MPLTPPTKNNFYFSILLLIIGIVLYAIGSFETWNWIAIFNTGLVPIHWLWYLLMGIFLLMSWLLLMLGCAWKRM